MARLVLMTVIREQEEHHRTRSFREELEMLLRKSGVSFDAKYLD